MLEFYFTLTIWQSYEERHFKCFKTVALKLWNGGTRLEQQKIMAWKLKNLKEIIEINRKINFVWVGRCVTHNYFKWYEVDLLERGVKVRP